MLVGWRFAKEVTAVVCAVIFLSMAGTAGAGSPPNRLDDNRGNGLTIGGEVLVHAALEAVCPIPLLCDIDVGARVQGTPDIFNVFADGNWNADNPNSPTVSQINSMASTIVGSSYLDHANQYGVHRGTFKGSHEADACFGAPSGSTGFVSLLAWFTCEVQVPGTSVPYPDDNTTYAILLREGTTVTGAIGADCTSASAFHAWSAAVTIQFVLFVPVPTIQGYPFMVVPTECAKQAGTVSMDTLSTLYSHELAEAAIDPFPPTGWIDNSQFDLGNLPQYFSVGEPADICQPGSSSEVPTTPVRMTNGFVVGTYWSNSDNACVPFGQPVSLAESGLPGSVAHTATVNGQTVTLPFTDQLEVGTSFNYSYPTPVNDPSPGVRYVTSDAGQSLTISGPVNDTATYTKQFFLTTGTSPGFLASSDPALTPSGWHDTGQVVTLDTSTPISTGPGDRYRFGSWTGPVNGLGLNPTVTMNAPKSVTANYVLQHSLLFDQNGIPSAVPWHVASVTTANENTVDDLGPYATWADDGSPVTYAYESTVPGAAGVQYVLTSATPLSPFTLNAAANVLGAYKTQFQLTVNTTGLGTNLTHITNSGSLLGTANDTVPLTVWIDASTALALAADANVDGTGGVQYFFQGFTPVPPAAITSPFTTTAAYLTMAQLIANALASGGISGPGSNGIGTSLTQKFDNIQKQMGAPRYTAALGQLGAFVSEVQAQTGQKITAALSTTLQLDAMLVYHNALCKGKAAGQIGSSMATNDYAFYAGLVTGLGGTVLAPC